MGFAIRFVMAGARSTTTEAIWDPTVNNPANNTLGAYWYGTTHANGRTQLESNKYNTVLPRVGILLAGASEHDNPRRLW